MDDHIHSPHLLERWNGSQRRIGLTGSIASGKSSVGKFLREVQSLPVIDADLYAKDALHTGSITTEKILNRYGKLISNEAEGKPESINRSALGEIIFSNTNERLWVESVIHPIVIEKINSELDSKKDEPIIVLIIPLLFEVNLTNICSEIWVVNCTPIQQIERLIKRDKLSKKDAIARISSQWSLEVKVKLADKVIDNTNTDLTWINQVEKFLK